MIKADELRDFIPAMRFADEQFTCEQFHTLFSTAAEEQGLPLAFYFDEVKYGGLLSRKKLDCLVMYHPDHKNDYFKFVAVVGYEGNSTIMEIREYGESKQIKKADRAEFAKKDRKGKSLSYKFGSLIGQGIANIGKSKSKLEAEDDYYMAFYDLVDSLFE